MATLLAFWTSVSISFQSCKQTDVRLGTIPPQVDERFARFVQFLTRDSPRQRAQDAWETAAQLQSLRTEVFGPSRFLPLDMDEPSGL